MENKIERGEIESNEWEYQLQQKSLFDQEKSPYNRELTPDQKQVRSARMVDTWKDIVS